MAKVRDSWAAGDAYEQFMGRWSRQLASRFVTWLQAPEGLDWLDVGCGTGALTDAICREAAPASVVGCDPARPLIDYARDHARHDRARFEVAAAGSLPRRGQGYHRIVSLLALNFIPEPADALREMGDLLHPQGVIAACVWDYAGGMAFLRHFWDAAAQGDAAARGLDEGARFPLCRAEALEALFRQAGLEGIRCEPLEIPTRFDSFDDYWQPLLGGTGPAPSYVASLDPPRRERLARTLDDTLPRGPDGSIDLVARAWAVRGMRR